MASAIEHLTRAENLARQARARAELNAPVLVRSWPYLTAAAEAASKQIPLTDDARTIERISLTGNGLHEANQRDPWPGRGVGDPHVAKVVDELRSAGTASSPVSADEAATAQRLLASTLWQTAYLLSAATRDHLVDLRRTAEGRSVSTAMSRELQLVRHAHNRTSAAGNLAASLMLGRPTEISDTARTLTGAVATWDVNASRALLTERSTTTLALVAHHEAAVQRGMAAALHAAKKAEAIDPLIAQRLVPVVVDLSRTWHEAADQITALQWGTQLVPRPVAESGRELVAQFKLTDLTQETAESRATILTGFSGHLASSMALATTARELLSDGELRAPARAVKDLLMAQEGSRTQASVSPVDLLRGGSIPLPQAARGYLEHRLDAVCFEAEEAVARSSGLDSFHRRPDDDARLQPRGPRPPAPPTPGLGLNPQPLVPPI